MKIFTPDGHLQDAALLLICEGGLGRRLSQKAQTHLYDCERCLTRQKLLQSGEARLRTLPPPTVPAQADTARARLQASLLEAAAQSPGTSPVRRWCTVAFRPAMLLRVGAVAALLLLAVSFRQAGRPLQDLMAAYEETGPKPNHSLTPGSAQAISLEEVCQRTDEDLDPKLSVEKQRAVFQAYRLDERTAKAYQVDYLINPQLGGDDTLKNLWPEPYHATVWNATAKDALEARLHGMVCNQQIDLQSAQRDIAGDWIAAYKKYFHASRPVSTIASINK